ncbi:hypothetical protein ACFL20_06360 [Spirochaetota bacterium]
MIILNFLKNQLPQHRTIYIIILFCSFFFINEFLYSEERVKNENVNTIKEKTKEDNNSTEKVGIVKIIKSNLSNEKPVKGNIVFFKITQNSIQFNALLDQSEIIITESLHSLGRFLPVEVNRKESAILKSFGKKLKNPYKKAAEILNVQVFIVLRAYKRGKYIFSEMDIFPLSKTIIKNHKKIIVKSRFLTNIPLKLSRELIHLHDKIKLSAKVIKRYKNNMAIINAGQWHGLKSGKHETINGEIIEVVKTGRYRSIIKLGKISPKDGNIILKIYPKTDNIKKKIEKRIDNNVIYKYGLKNTLLKGSNPEKKFVQATCIYNIGSNICVPAYGAFLTTGWLGFQSKSSSIPGMAASSTLIFLHLMMPEFLSGFKTNFLPFIKAKDKKYTREKQLEYFLWASLPVTFSVAFFDQLAYQMHKTEHVPPFYGHKDVTALALSALIPGGGLFYKGYRILGWAYYLSEMTLASYCIYSIEDNDNKWMYILSALGGLKLIELINAYFINPSYDFEKIEKERGTIRSYISISVRPQVDGLVSLGLSMNYKF